MVPSVELLAVTEVTGAKGLTSPTDLIEFSGRVDYGPKSVAKFGDPEIVGRWIESGHQSMIEMADAAFLITCSRVVSHELVRHRIASYQQESQRYVKYDDETSDTLFYVPDAELSSKDAGYMRRVYAQALESYKTLRASGVPAQIARYVLPNGTRTRIVMKANLREWRHFLKLRCHSSAQPEMQIIANKILEVLYGLYPVIFEDVYKEIKEGRRAVR